MRWRPSSSSLGFIHAFARVVACACAVAIACGAMPRLAHAQISGSDSTAVLLWTAPGDDGTSGRANRYEMRVRSVAIAGTDTVTWWNAGTAVTGLPTPSVAGATDSVQVRGLDPTKTWYFVLRTADEVPNWSGWSNVAIRAPYSDRIPPASVSDLQALMTGLTPLPVPEINGVTPAHGD